MNLKTGFLASLVCLLTLAWTGGAPPPCVEKPCSAATNHADDILGEPDIRPATWGRAGFHLHYVRFYPPLGYRTKILRVYGDLVIWPTTKGNGPAIVPPGTFAGTLWGLSRTSVNPSAWMAPASEGCFVYLQLATSGEPERAAFDFDLSADGMLGPDDILESKVAVWLNDTGLQIHMEPTWVTVYQFVIEEERQP